MIKPIKVMAAIAALFTSFSVSATSLSASTSVDNGYEIYLSTTDASQGTQFGSGNWWYTTFTDTTTLTAGTDYYLHIHAYDQGGIAGFLGDFSLSGSDHLFSNGFTALSTNTTDWSGNNSGWGNPYAPLTALGLNGVSPWGTRAGISAGAQWIWAGNAWDNNQAWFSTKISAVRTAVPESSSLILMALGLLGLMSVRRKA